MILSQRVCFTERVDIWFAIFEALFGKILKFSFALLFTKEKGNFQTGRPGRVQAGHIGRATNRGAPATGPAHMAGQGPERPRPRGRSGRGEGRSREQAGRAHARPRRGAVAGIDRRRERRRGRGRKLKGGGAHQGL